MTLEEALEAIEQEKKRGDRAEAERDAARNELEGVRRDSVTHAVRFDQTMVARRAALEFSARKILGADAMLSTMSDLEVMRTAIARAEPSARLDGKSDEFVRGQFDAAVERVRS
jgi:hypothetical protein